MEPVTHLAAGLLTAQTLRRPGEPSSRALTWLCAIAATIPDLDSLAGWLGPEAYLLHHRGLTHSLPMLPLYALLLAWAAKGLGARLSLRRAFAAAALALATHLFLDVVTAFGTQLFAPFSDRRVSFEGVYVVDPAFTLALLGMALAARLKPLRARTLALCGLGLLLAYPLAGNALRLGMQARLEASLRDAGQTVDALWVTPDPLAPWYWKVVVAQGPDLVVTTATPARLTRGFPVTRVRRVEPNELLRLGEQASIFRTYAWFAEHPVELPAEEDQGLRQRRFADATFLHTGPVLAALFGQGRSFAEIDALFDASGRLSAWRDWSGRTHPVPELAGCARAGTLPPRP